MTKTSPLLYISISILTEYFGFVMASIQFKKSRTGKKTYYVVVSFSGKHKWLRAGTQKEAKILKRQIESLENSQRMEKLGLVSEAKRIDNLFQEYADHVRLHNSKNTVKRYLGVLNTFLVFLKMFHPGIRYLSQITPDHIESYQRQRLESLELKTVADGEKNGIHRNKKLPLPQTVNYEVSVLRSAFIWAKNRDLISTVPTQKIKKLKPKIKRRKRILSPKECKLFLKTARDMARQDRQLAIYYKTFKFLLNTGLRSGELCNITWSDIDLDAGLIKIQEKEGWSPKTYTREFYLNQESIELLKSLEGREGYVFKSLAGEQLDSDGLRRVLIRVTKAAEIEDFTRVHDLRHTFNSLMQMNGVDPATMAKILGHKDIETTMIYTHQTDEHLKKSIEKVGIG